MVGTFDVANYGDLLFPVLAERKLRARIADVELVLFGYRPMDAPVWPHTVRDLADLPAEVGEFDLVLIGGGQLVHNHTPVAPGYHPASLDVHDPLGLWLTPMLAAASAGVPVAWNAVGVSPGIPTWAGSLLAAAVDGSTYLAVRDADSALRLREHVGAAPIQIVPDTALDAAELVPDSESDSMKRFRADHHLDGGYCIVQPCGELGAVRDRVDHVAHTAVERGLQVLELPISPCHGDRTGALELSAPTITPHAWPNPTLLTELIARSEGVMGVSFHLGLVALAAGVPQARPEGPAGWKYEYLEALDGVQVWAPSGEDGAAPFLDGPRPMGADAARRAQLEHHWDRVVASAQVGRAAPADGFARRMSPLVSTLDAVARDYEGQIAHCMSLAAEAGSLRDALGDAVEAASANDARAAELAAAITRSDAAIARSDARIAELNEILHATQRVVRASRSDLAEAGRRHEAEARRLESERDDWERRWRTVRSRKAVRLALPAADVLGSVARAPRRLKRARPRKAP